MFGGMKKNHYLCTRNSEPTVIQSQNSGSENTFGCNVY